MTTASAKKYKKEDFEFVSLLGQGAIGKVFHARHCTTRQDVALKIVQKNRIDTHQRDQLFVERLLLQSIQHTNVIKLYGTFQDQHALYFVLEYAGRGDVAEHLNRWGMLPYPIAKFVAAEAVNALACLRLHKVVHRDIKPENLLIGSDGHIKLTDFNSARFVEDGPSAPPTASTPTSTTASTPTSTTPSTPTSTTPSTPTSTTASGEPTTNTYMSAQLHNLPSPTATTSTHLISSQPPGLLKQRKSAHHRGPNFVGTPQYLAPEAVATGNDHSVGYEADIWAFGVFLFKVLTGQYPVADTTNVAAFDNISIPHSIPKDARNLIEALLVVKEPKRRLGAANVGEIMRHRFFDGVDWALLESSEPPDITSLTQYTLNKSTAAPCDFDFTPDIDGSFGRAVLECSMELHDGQTLDMSLRMEVEGQPVWHPDSKGWQLDDKDDRSSDGCGEGADGEQQGEAVGGGCGEMSVCERARVLQLMPWQLGRHRLAQLFADKKFGV